MKDTLHSFDAGKGKTGFYYSLPALEEKGLGKISRLPVSIRIVLESVLRNCDGKKVAEKDVETLAAWNAKAPAQEEIDQTVKLRIDTPIEVDYFRHGGILPFVLRHLFT